MLDMAMMPSSVKSAVDGSMTILLLGSIELNAIVLGEATSVASSNTSLSQKLWPHLPARRKSLQ